jgi:Icc-related predicted phosphoesterase
MRVGMISDTHGHFPEVEPCDLFLIAGDMANGFLYELNETVGWYDRFFRAWIKSIPAERVIYVAGNHDFAFEKERHKMENLYLPGTYLEDQGTGFKGYKIWGSPWQPRFGNWAFNADEDELYRRFDWIPLDTEILITHGPPLNILDKTMDHPVYGEGKHVGSKALLEKTWKLPKLKIHVFGHIHPARGRSEIAECHYVNATHVDYNYQGVYDPIYIDLPDK